MMLSRFFKERSGSSSLEFAVVFPFVIGFFFIYFETGWTVLRASMLERGVDIAARELRLGIGADTHDELRDSICDNAAILADCKRVLVLQVVELDISSAYPRDQATCYDRVNDLQPALDFTPGARSQIMFIRACMIIDPIFPGVGLGLGLPKDASGGHQMVSYSAFMNEPL